MDNGAGAKHIFGSNMESQQAGKDSPDVQCHALREGERFVLRIHADSICILATQLLIDLSQAGVHKLHGLMKTGVSLRLQRLRKALLPAGYDTPHRGRQSAGGMATAVGTLHLSDCSLSPEAHLLHAAQSMLVGRAGFDCRKQRGPYVLKTCEFWFGCARSGGVFKVLNEHNHSFCR